MQTTSSNLSPAATSPSKARLALLCLAVSSLPALAQSAPDAARGKLLYTDTANVEGVADSITGVCTNCHGAVQNRRAHITGSNTAYLSYDTALNRFGSAVNSVGNMSQFRALSSEQLEDIAAYIADVPYVTVGGVVQPEQSNFSATAVGNALSRNVSITHSTTSTDNLRISSISLGSAPNGFAASSSCNNVVLTPGNSCTFSVTYTPTSATVRSVGLQMSLVEGTATSVSRSVILQGSVVGAPPPPAPTPPPPAPAPAPAGDSGGGALGWTWLVGLSLGTAALATRRRTKSDVV